MKKQGRFSSRCIDLFKEFSLKVRKDDRNSKKVKDLIRHDLNVLKQVTFYVNGKKVTLKRKNRDE